MQDKPELDSIEESVPFSDFNLNKHLISSLKKQGIVTTFPIQKLTLPVTLSGADIIGQARTGTGKTLAFGLPILNNIDREGSIQGLVIVPTRELCIQVANDFSDATRFLKTNIQTIYGGTSITKQISQLKKGVHVIVGTPGRLIDLITRGHLDLSTIKYLVLDEADEMLNMGFLADIETIISHVPSDRQTMLFSATMPTEIVQLGRKYMTSPTFMRTEMPQDDTIHDRIDQYFFEVHRMDKPALASRILASPRVNSAVVFCRTKRMVDRLVQDFKKNRLNSRAIHSSLNQRLREKTLDQFRNGEITILVATEVAARGLDIDDVTHVINYDMPDETDMYVHRIGRTGRAGRKGIAITLALNNELPRLHMILRELEIEDDIPEMFSTSPELETLFGVPPLQSARKRTNAYGTVDFDEPRSARSQRKRRKTVRVGLLEEKRKRQGGVGRRRTKVVTEDGAPVEAFADADGSDGSDGSTRRSRRGRYAEDGSSSRRSRRTRYVDDSDGEDTTSRRSRRTRYVDDSDGDNTTSRRSRRTSYGDDSDGDDTSTRRSRRTRRDDNDQESRKTRRRSTTYIDDTDEGDDSSSRRSRRTRYEDDSDGDDTTSRRSRRTRYEDGSDGDDTSSRRSRRTRRDDNDQESGKTRRRSTTYIDDAGEDDDSSSRRSRSARRSQHDGQESDDMSRSTQHSNNARRQRGQDNGQSRSQRRDQSHRNDNRRSRRSDNDRQRQPSRHNNGQQSQSTNGFSQERVPADAQTMRGTGIPLLHRPMRIHYLP